MANLTKEIFLASRFKEFEEIRRKLADKINDYYFMEAIDLNDNQASHRSPLEESLFHVRKSEIMILLVGETYGTVPEGESKSYTHLEYDEAVKESSNTRVLVFCIGKPYAGEYIEYSKTDKNMKEWQIELEKNHRLSKFGDENDVDRVVEKIMIMLLSSVYDLNPQENLDLVEDDELYLDDLSEEEDDFLHNEEVEFLDNKLSEQGEINIAETNDDKTEGFELLKIPGKLAALEQKKEAQIAIEIQDYYTARQHLKKALEFRPLDFETNYWLAKLYVASAKKNLFFEIEEYLLRAAKIALQDNNRFKASHCYQLIIQAAIFSDKENEGLKYIQLAEEITPNFARLYYEKAKFMLYFNHKGEAKKALTQAMNIRMEILKDIARDPFFLQYKDVINEIKVDMKNHLYKSCYAISSQANDIKKRLDIESKPIDLANLSIYELWSGSRKSFIEQYKLLSSFITNVEDDDIPSMEEELIDLEERSAKEKESILTLKEDKLIDAKLKNEKALDESLQRISSVSLFSGLGSFIMVMAIVVMVVSDKVGSYMFIPIGALILLLALVFYVFSLRKNIKMKNAQALENSIHNIQEESERDLINLEKNKVEMKQSLEDEIENLKTEYENIHKAFKIFEFNTVSKSSSKLVPFKSLNNASKGSVVRITPHSYKKYIDKGNSIEILEDFPASLVMKEVDTENNSFLAKVKNKDRASIVLSRYKAYKDKSLKEEKEIKTDTYHYSEVLTNDDEDPFKK